MKETAPPRRRSDQETSNWYLLIFLPFVVLAFLYLKISLQSILVRNEIGYPEGASIFACLLALRTGKLYALPFEFPFNAQIYGPVFYIIGLVFAKVAHGNQMMTTELLRLLSFFSFLGSAGLIGYLSWRLEMAKRWVAASIVLSLACAWATPFASARPDCLSIFLILGALTFYEVAQGRRWLLFWVGVLGTLSCLTKQNTAPILLALVIDSMFARKLQNWASLVAGCIPVPVLIVSALWLRHEPFLPNVGAVGQAVFDWPGAAWTAINIMRTNQIAVIPISIALVGAVSSWRVKKYRSILLVGAFAWLSNIAALANVGGSVNYLILPWLLTILMIPAGLARIATWTPQSVAIPFALTLLGGVFIIHQRNFLPLRPYADLDTSGVENINILSDHSYLELHSRQPELLDPLLYHHFALQGAWSDAPIRQEIGGEKFDLIVIGGEDGLADSEFLVMGYRGISRWGADTLGEMVNHYRVLCEVPGFLALVPRDRSGILRDEDIGRIFRHSCRSSDRIPRLALGMR